MRGAKPTKNGRIALLAVLFQEWQQGISDLHIQINGDLRCPKYHQHSRLYVSRHAIIPYLVEQKDIPRLHEAHAQLHSPPLTIRDSVHVPVEVHVEYIKQTITTLLVAIPAYWIQKMLNLNVTAHDRVHGPVNPLG
jgi:hypothetical protein